MRPKPFTERLSLPVTAVLLLGASFGAVSCTPRKSEVRMAYPPIVASLPMFLAMDQDLFAKEGVEASTGVFESSNDMVSSLVAGQTDMLPAVSLIPIIHLELQYPGKVRLFSHSRMRPENAFDSILVLESSPVRTLSDLAGKKVGVFPGSSAQNLLRAFLNKHGVRVEHVSFVPLAPSAQLGSLLAGAIDALFSYEPITTTAGRDPRYRRLYGSVYADLLNPCPVGASVISRSFEGTHPEAAHRAITAIDRAVMHMREQPSGSKALLPRFTKIEPDVAALVNVVDVTRSDEVDVENLQAFIDLLHEIGEIPERVDARRLTAP